MLGKVFKAYDVRAIYPNPLNEQTAWKIGFGTARFLLGQAEAAGKTDPMMKHIVIGRDMRKSSPALAKALSEGIRTFGGHVIDVGLVDTPFVYFAINYLDCAGGVQTTASHNPAEYNGFKISGRHALPVGQGTGLDEISKFAAMADFEKIQGTLPLIGRTEDRDLWDGYRDHVLSFLELAKARNLKIVVDASNGMAGTLFQKVFSSIRSGWKIIEMNFDNTTGEFVHEPNPLVPANIQPLRERVLKEKADFGVCFDGDADRAIFVDEKAQTIGCDHLTALLARRFLEHEPDQVVAYDLRSSRAVREEVLKAGGKPVESRVGHVFMKQILREQRGIFAGELSGHFYFRDNFSTDSGAIVFAIVASMLSESKVRLSELIRPIARYAQSGEINFSNDEPDAVLANLLEHFASQSGVRLSTLDGITIDCFESRGWWCNIRKSNTEPLVRLNLEARDRPTCERVLNEFAPLLGQRVNH